MKISRKEYEALIAAKAELDALNAKKAAADRLREAQEQQTRMITQMVVAATRHAPGGPVLPAYGLYPFG